MDLGTYFRSPARFDCAPLYSAGDGAGDAGDGGAKLLGNVEIIGTRHVSV